MDIISKTQVKRKVTSTGRYTPTSVAQIIKGDILFGYKRLSIIRQEDNTFKISKWDLGDNYE